ncbi:MAG: carboxypeptidase regulatory-like domain-containing protein [Chryseobacterium cucumeris]|nr:MAG: carboxypeptidase regulatory-like domain-containing protein [Chryseobacterium cucumeris]
MECKGIIFLSILLFLSILSNGQREVNGYIINTHNKPVASASITVLNNKLQPLSYTLSDHKGYFSIIIPGFDSLKKLKIAHVQYEIDTIEISAILQLPLNITLTDRNTQLPEVTVKSIPGSIKQRSDTIDYNVDFFKGDNDRVLKDVLAKLPGITLGTNGTILYQNKPINNFYIDGDDILGSRYNIATNNLPVDAIEKIQVLEKHQPIKLLKGTISSDKAAINIQTSKSVKKIMGRQVLLAGYNKEMLRNAQLSLFKINGKNKFVSSLKHNNIGLDFSQELTSLTQKFDLDDYFKNLVSIHTTSFPPSLNPQRINFNNDFSQSNNTNFKIGENSSLKLFTGFISKKNHQNIEETVNYFYPDDTLHIFKNNYIINNTQEYHTSAEIIKNSENNYFNNHFLLKFIRDNKEGIITGVNHITQKASLPLFKMNNDLNLILKRKEQFYFLNSVSSFKKQNQDLNVTPGVFAQLINDGKNYFASQQNVNLQHFKTDNNIRFLMKKRNTQLGIKTGLALESKAFETLLQKYDSTSSLIYGSFQNKITSNLLNTYTELNSSIQLYNSEFQLNLKPNFHFLHYKTENSQKWKNIYSFSPDANIAFLHQFSTKWNSSISYGNTKTLTDLQSILSHYFLENYYSISKSSDIDITNFKEQKLNINIAYKNIAQLLFANASALRMSQTSDIIHNSLLNPKGYLEITAKAFDNKRITQTYNGNISKYLYKLKTNIKMGLQFSETKYPVSQNNIIRNYSLNTISLSGKVAKEFSKKVSIQYDLNYSNNQNKEIGKAAASTITHLITQNILLDVANKICDAKISLEHNYFQFKNNQTFFTGNINLSKKLNKKPIDISLDILNILNQKKFITSAFDGSNLSITNFNLRPINILAGIRFNL